MGSCSATTAQSDPWWKVDLGRNYKINAVIITGKDQHPLNGVEIWVDASKTPNVTSFRCGVIPVFGEPLSGYLSCNGAEGQFVRLLLPGANLKLELCEVQVYSTDFAYPQPNVAVKGRAVQSSTLYPAEAHRAIDGRRDTFYTEGSCSHTAPQSDPWWRVDLGQPFIVSNVKVTNRGDCCADRLDGAQIRIGNSLKNNGNDNPWCTNVTHIPLGNTFTFTCKSTGTTGRYVNLLLSGEMRILTLCEVEVYADPAVEALSNIANYKPALQSSTKKVWDVFSFLDAGAHKVVQTCRTHRFDKLCCSQTHTWRNPWWRVDLGAPYRVSAVVLHNRHDCCSSYIIGAQIRIGNSRTIGQNPVCSTITNADLKQTFYCSEMEGQYVSVNIKEITTLTFCRVEVYGSRVDRGPAVHLVGGRLCWSDALFYCRRHHWDLLSVQSHDEQTQVEQLIAKSVYPLSENVWLGLRRELMGMRWFWMSGEALTFNQWRLFPPLFPNPCGGVGRTDGLWSPLSCAEHNNFLCQSAPAQSSTKVYYYSSKMPRV
uniref:C-type lectin domain-containing protein n=1 Tax=Knipowitschia caucasica TaxID=637954 RepID=A0AAV2KMD6_KNICA